MGPAMKTARLYFWGARALYLGPALGLTPHRNAVAVLCVGYLRNFEVAHDPENADTGYVACRAALIPPNTLHHLRCGDQPMACLYIDAQSDDFATLRGGMTRIERRVALEITGEAAYLGALARLQAGEAWANIRGEIAAALGLRRPARRDEAVSGAVRRLHADPAEGTDLADLAARAGLSPSRFLHRFKDATGVPFRRYRVWARMGAAVRSIVVGGNLTDAAYDAGFSSSAHFSAAFREMFGMPPSVLSRARFSIVESPRSSQPDSESQAAAARSTATAR
jgi:AraC-like DNA-binding protein